MANVRKITPDPEGQAVTGLEKLRQPFPPHQISKLPKPTKRQTDEVRADFKKGIRCKVCGQWHHPDVVHLDYVGHAALTDRLLDCDPQWAWEPVAWAQEGRPLTDEHGGMWIKLTVCGVTRLGYGHPDGKRGGDAVKETIGDALRNAAMRFGAALDLWHKGDLHAEEPDETPQEAEDDAPSQQAVDAALTALRGAPSVEALRRAFVSLPQDIKALPNVIKAKDERKAALEMPVDDEIPY